MAKPLVSVLIDTYNHERYIEQAILSVLEQDFPAGEMEILVVDDGSTDRTSEIIDSLERKFASRLRILRKANGGQASAFNAGLRELSGEIVCFLDGDDWWAKEKVSRVVRAFDENPGVAAVGHGYYEVDDGAIRGRWLPGPGARLALETPALALQSTSLRIFLGTSRLAMRRSALDKIMPLPTELTICADTPLLTLAPALGGAVILDELLCYYRVHSGNYYASDAPTEAQAQTRYRLLRALLALLPARLEALGVSDAAIAAFLDFDRLEAARLKLVLEGGTPWETYRVESAIARASYRDPSFGYRVFKDFTLLLALLMPPRQFYRMRHWYGSHGLQHWRKKIGTAADTVKPVNREHGSSRS